MELSILKNFTKDKLPPGTIRKHVNDEKEIALTVLKYNADSLSKDIITTSQVKDIEIPSGFNCWIHCPSTLNSKVLEEIGKKYSIHNLILENIQNIDHRPKLNDTEKFNFIIQKQLTLKSNTLTKNHIGYIYFENLLITFSNDNPFKTVEERLSKKEGKVRFKNIDYLLFALMDLLTDEYFELIYGLQQKTMEFEENLVDEDYKLDISTFLKLKSNMEIVRHYVTPLPQIIEGILNSTRPPIDETNRIYYKDLLNNTLQIIDIIGTTINSIDNVLNLSINISGYKMNSIMKILTIISTIFIPLTFIAGLYGMNFLYIPELKLKYGYPAVIAIMIIIGLAMVNFFRKKRWF